MTDKAMFTAVPTSSPTPTVPWTPRDVVAGLVMALGWILAIILFSGIAQRFGLTIDPSFVIVLGTAILLLPVWYYTIYKYRAAWQDLGLGRFQLKAVGLGCGLMLVSLLFNLVYATILSTFGLQIQPDIAPMFAETDFPLMLLFGGAIVAPFVEEIFFRGFVFSGLRRRFDWKIAALISAGLFAILHVVPTSFLPILILGLIFALLYQISGSIWPAILMHMLTNTLALSAAYAVSQGWIPTP